MIEPIVKFGDDGDIGQAIQSLISDNLSRLNTCYLAKVDSVDENKVNVVFLMGDCKMVIPSLLVGIPQSKAFLQGMKIEAGDVGLCLVCDKDISVYKDSQSGGKLATSRSHDLIDSIFIPLSLCDSNIQENLIESKEGLSIKAKEVLEIQGQLLTLKSENASLKTTLAKLADILAGLTTINAVQGSPLTLSPSTISDIQQWKLELDQLLKE